MGGCESKVVIDSIGVRGPECGPGSVGSSESDHSDSEVGGDSSTLTLSDRACAIAPL